jgi:uncharacterized protein (DUF1778 family)
MLESAASNARTSLSDFIRRTAIEAAEAEILGRNRVTIKASDWERFEAWIDASAVDVPALRKLASHKPVWQH